MTTEKHIYRALGALDAGNRPGTMAFEPTTVGPAFPITDADDRAVTRPISPREQEVAAMLAAGHGVASIALRLHISAHTVRNHLKALYRKSGCRSQRGLVGWLRRNGDRAPHAPTADRGLPRGEVRALTNREREIFRSAADGRRPDEIAREMAISPNTAKNHLKAIYRKLGVRSAVELMARGAHDLGTEI